MKKQWHDQHLKSCTCKKCYQVPIFIPDKPSSAPNAFTLQSVIDKFYPTYKLPYELPSSGLKPVWASSVVNSSGPVFFNSNMSHMIDLYTPNVLIVNSKLKPSPGASICFEGNTLYIKGKWTLGSNAIFGSNYKNVFKPILTFETPEVPAIELLDTSNPFAKALDAWQTGKVGWIKKSMFKNQSQPEGEVA